MERTTRALPAAAIAIIPPIAAWLAGMIATFPHLEPWYVTLIKPSFSLPNWVFAPVWISLYFLMMVAAWRILRSDHPSKRLALSVFFGQLILNAAWSWMFFAAQSPLLGLVNIVPQLVFALVTTSLFFRIDRLAGWSLVPLCIWVGFATLLNLSIWWLNS